MPCQHKYLRTIDIVLPHCEKILLESQDDQIFFVHLCSLTDSSGCVSSIIHTILCHRNTWLCDYVEH